ncbi:MAG: hypothetical protein ACOH14_06340 [Rhodoglobus sp.]
MSDSQWGRPGASAFDGLQESADPATDPHMFMATNNIGESDFRTALTEYRSLDTGYVGSPWAMDEIGVLAADFINWYRWERL